MKKSTILKHITKNPTQTRKLGEVFAEKILRKNSFLDSRKFAIVLGLEGDLGGGKTTFLQGLAKGLGIKQKILSPTFIIFRKFEIRNPKFKSFYHYDCYRIEKPKEVLDLNFKEIVKNPRNIVAAEWADRIKKIIPSRAVWIKFEFIAKTTRKIVIKKELSSLMGDYEKNSIY